MIWIYVILASLAGGVLSLLIGLLIVFNKKEKSIEDFATSFAAGTLLSAAFLDLIPEALETNSSFNTMLFVMFGLIFFFLLEGILHFFHNHAHSDGCEECVEIEKKPFTLMIMLGDTLHNFFDGIAIAAGFLISPTTGWLITIAIILHEIPQEIGDIALMRQDGGSKKKVILLNTLSSLASVIGAILFYALGSKINIPLSPFFSIVAGFFIYIAATDIIPTIHQEKNKKTAFLKMAFLLLGALILGLLIWFL